MKEINQADMEIKTVVYPPTDDGEYIREVAEAKRALELWTMEPEFQKDFMAAPEKTLAAHGIHIDPLSVQILCLHEYALQYQKRPEADLPRVARRYRGFIKEKQTERARMIQEKCVPVHPAFRTWRARQMNRCWAELGSRNGLLVHVPVSFELNLGCSVGCPFCGLMAGRLQKVSRYEEDGALWKGMLSFLKETVGDAAGQGTCYYATEPFDNPDYEKFADDYFAVFGVVPQVTTAVAMRKPERTRAYLEKALQQYRRVHRFSVLSLDVLYKIFDTFTMEELLCMELLPQFAEAPHNQFARTGRARNAEDIHVEEEDGNTIACVTGFIVNLAERSIRLITPCGASEAHPTGEIIVAKESFTDLDDFKRVFTSLIDRYMKPEFSKEQPLWLRAGITFEKTEEGIEFVRKNRMRLKFRGEDNLPADLYHAVLDKLTSGGKSAYDIAGELMDEKDTFPAHVFFILKKFEQAGLFLEPYESKTESSS